MAAVVTIPIKNNAWFLNAFRFGTLGDVTWSFTGKSFLCDLKQDPDQAAPDLALSSTDSPATLVVLDPAARILQFSVTDIAIRAALSVGPYRYDLIMVDDVTGERNVLMGGVINVSQGITIED